jgi:NAD(P)-dependent dehydrogenase (short-subunit alcohol dehydrogenase family)
MDWKNKVAVVTGANRGLGRETVRELAAIGLKVVLTARDPEKGQKAVESLQKEGLQNLVFFPLDVTEESSVKALRDFLKKEFGRIDVLVNNAGVFLDGKTSSDLSFFGVNTEVLENTFTTNLFGPVLVARELIPLMKGKGRVVNVSSGMGQLSEMNGGYPAYRMSKTALNALTKILADELQSTEIKVNSVCPGWVRTDMSGEIAERSIPQGAETIVWAATLSEDGPTGKFLRDKKVIPF